MLRRTFLSLAAVPVLPAPVYDLVLRGGHVIDPANRIDAAMDVAVSGSKIARVAPSIPASHAKKSVDVGGLYVVPGLVDLHIHVDARQPLALFPDETALPTGSTTVVDAGTSGWRTFDDFKARIIDRATTRVLALLNIVGSGMAGPKFEDNVEDMDPAATAAKIRQHAGTIVGIKTAHFGPPGWAAVNRAVEAGRRSGTPVMVDGHIFTDSGRTSREELLERLRPGDIHTHVYNDRQVELLNRFTGKVQPYIWKARERGVLFDMGHGAGSFLWPVATRAMAQGFPPDSISTDLHAQSVLGTQPDMPNCISKLVNLGMPFPEAIARSTVNPARAIRRFPELGTLGEGRGADIAVLELKTGVFAFKDAWLMKFLGNRKVECVLTVRGGRVVYDRDGLSFPEWTRAGEYEVIR